MTNSEELPLILIADDDPSDRMIAVTAFRKVLPHNPIREVKNGEELMEYLLRQGKYADPSLSPEPRLIILDINMPKKTGLEALKEIRSNPRLLKIPVVVMTTSKSDEDVVRSYGLGASSIMTKSAEPAIFFQRIREICEHWL